MTVSRRTFLRLLAAGLSSAAIPLTGCVDQGRHRGIGQLPTPDAPFTPTEDWYFVTNRGIYEADLAHWRIRLAGLVEQPLTLRFDELVTRFASTVRPVTLSCVGDEANGRLLSATW